MTPMPLLLLAAAAVGVDTGWTKLDSGGYEYIIQIPPEQLDALRAGGEFGSDLPADTGEIRSYRVVIGTGPLVNQGVPLPPEARVTFKPPVGEEKSAGATSDASIGRQPQLSPTELWRRTGAKQPGAASASDATGPIVIGNDPPPTDEVEEPLFFDRNSRRTARDDAEPPSGETTPVVQIKDAKSKLAEADSPSDFADPTVAKEPQEWRRSKFQWTLLVVGLIFFGGLNGYLGWLAIDFRNRYLELLRDLDTQPAEQPVEESSRRHDEEESSDEDESPRELVRTAHTYVGRKENQRRRDREQERYDEE